MEKRNISIVSNDKLYSEEIAEYIKLNGFDSKAFSLDEFSQYIKNYSMPDLIILDLNFNIHIGLEIIKELKKRYSLVNTPIFVISSFIDSEDEVNNLINEYGFNDCFIKPLNPDHMIEEIKKILK